MGLPCGTFQEDHAHDMAIYRTRLHWLMLAALLIFIFTLPLYASGRWLSLAILIGITVVSVHGLNILTGYCGQISMGHAGFMAVGAYTSAVLCTNVGWSFWAALPTAALVAGIVGVIFGLPSLRIKGFYLIMATIAAQFIIIWVILQLYEITGGADGISVPRPEIGGIVLASKQSYYYLVMVLACLVTFFAFNLARTRVGRAFLAVRDNDLAAEVMGINLWNTKLLAFFIGCVFAGVGGALYVHYFEFATVQQFELMDSVWFLGMIIIGGMGTTAGVIFGVTFLMLLDELIIVVVSVLAALFPAVGPQLSASMGLIVHGLVIALFLIFEPRGLAHRWAIMKNYYRLWPFSY